MNNALGSLRRYRALVFVAAVLGVGVAALLTFLTPPTYTSSLSLFVTAAGPSGTSTDSTTAAYEGNLFSQQRVASYAEILTSRKLVQAVVDELRLPLTADTLAAEITATAVPDTVVLDVTVTDRSPRRAQRIASSIGRQFTDQVTALETPAGATASTVSVKTIQAAAYDGTPVGPDLTGNLWRGGAIGLVTGLLLALLRGRFDRRVRTDEEIRQAAGVGLLGRAYASRRLSRKHLVTALQPDSPAVDAYRALAAALLHDDQGGRVLVVAGCLPGDGGSTVAVNAAISLARTGTRVLLVDADLRRPRAAGYLGMPDTPGLTEVLGNAVPLEEAIRPWNGAPLSVLPAGALHANPGDLLGSARMQTLLKELQGYYDVVLVDAPPVLSLVDAALMSALSEGCLLVTSYGRTKSEQLAEAVESLGRVHATVLGVVLNRLPRARAVAVAATGDRAYRPDSGRGTAATAGVPSAGPGRTAAGSARAVAAGSTDGGGSLR